MADELELIEAPAASKKTTPEQKEFEHAGLGLRLVLKWSASELTYRRVEKFVVAFRRDKRGISGAEQWAKNVAAAISAGWIVEPKIESDEILDMLTSHLRWYSDRIDDVYRLGTEVPPES